ncbi:hypothetical protein RV11_GL001013 [Enterococcus phoeniculicola]|nr:hypothetical protein RV11_GL001013 [Enterococcus phoeniculicola]
MTIEESHFQTFSKYIRKEKLVKLSNWLIENKHIPRKKIKKEILKNYLLDTISLDQLLTENFLTGVTFYPNDKELITQIKQNNEFYLFYPILIHTKGTERPLLSFSCEITDEAYKITNFIVNREALIILIAAHLQQDALDVGNLYTNQLNDLIISTAAIENVTDVEEFTKLFLNEFQKALGFQLNFMDITDSDWRVVAQLKISCESLESVSGSCFEDELKTLYTHLVEKEQPLPPLLNNYFFHNQNKKNLTDLSLSEKYHYGSYQSKYPVTAKQWELVNLLPETDFLTIEGPPGTGKTTLLKEIIADTVVKKAGKLLDVWNNKWTVDNTKDIYRPPLGGKNLDSIILTSTNNKAINNIGLELIKEVPFFSEFTASLNDEDINGILCARLGNYKNVQNFHQTFFAPFLRYLTDAKLADDIEKETIDTFKETQKEIEEYNTCLNQFLFFKDQTAIASEKELEETKLRIQRELSHIFDQIQENDRMLNNSRLQLEELEKDTTIITLSIARNNHELEKSNEEKKKLFIAKESFRKISAVEKFLSKFPLILGSTKEFLSTYPSLEYISDLITDINATLEKITTQHNQFEERLLEKNTQLLTVKETITSILQTKETLQKDTQEKESYEKRLIAISKTLDYFSKNYDRTLLWSSTTHALKNSTYILALRETLFHCSLKLLEVYIIKNKHYILKNLEKVISDDYKWFKCLYNGNRPYDEFRADLVRTLYETFFLCFPVVSTTLHSFRKQSFPMIENLFDLLLFDESGQIVSYYATTPLYRARKTVFVGDTNQIEPIISVPEKILQEKYTELLGEETYTSLCINNNSAQSYAIKASNIYEERNQVQSSIVLNKHMRCEKSIMKFSNHYVYDDVLTFMNTDTTENKLLKNNLLAFDIRGIKSVQHFNQAEIEACQRIVATLVKEHGEDIKKDIGIITPFSIQAKKLSKLFDGKIAVGTVHTFQGDEKQIIIFSSVIDYLNKNSNGLTNFIGNKANLLNVAFSRAKKQFIYVGNFEAARESQNYLSKALQSITEQGKCYSLFESIEMSEEKEDLQKILTILSSTSFTNKESPVTTYLHEFIPENIIYGGEKHNELLMKLITIAEKSITIVSPWISNYVVNEHFLKIIDSQIKQGTTIQIFFGYKGEKLSVRSDIDKIIKQDVTWNTDGVRTAILALEKLLENNLVHNPPSHVKLLLIDNTYLFIGSLNWLMNSGKNNQKEISYLVTDKSSIEYVNQYYAK